jgi:hypothetical protein
MLKHTKNEPSVPPASRHEADKLAATALWKIVGLFALVVALSLMLGMSGEKIGSVTTFADINRYGMTLYGVPTLAAALIAVSFVGYKYSLAVARPSSWSLRVPPVVEGLTESSFRRPVALVVLIGFLFVPVTTLVIANATFFRGSYYLVRNVSVGCDESNMTKYCDLMGNYSNHFWPKKPGMSLRFLFNTPYRYEGNKTYIPVLFPSLLLLVSLAGVAFCLKCLISIFRRAH